MDEVRKLNTVRQSIFCHHLIKPFILNTLKLVGNQNKIAFTNVMLKMFEKCKSLPYYVNGNRDNDKDEYVKEKEIKMCIIKFNYTICGNKYKSPDSTNEYYSLKTILDKELNESDQKLFAPVLINLTIIPVRDIKAFSSVKIMFGEDIDTIYTH